MNEKMCLMETRVAMKSTKVVTIRFEQDTLVEEKDALLGETSKKLKHRRTATG